MNGAELIVKTALAAGIEICFSNPGTTEIPLVTALDSVPGIRAVLGLFEGVWTGAGRRVRTNVRQTCHDSFASGAGFE